MAMAFAMATHTGGGVGQYLSMELGELSEWAGVANNLLKSK